MRCGWARRTSSPTVGPKRGLRPPATRDQRTQSAYLFGAVCPAQGTGAAIVVPSCNSQAMQFHLTQQLPASPPARMPSRCSIGLGGMAPSACGCPPVSPRRPCRRAPQLNGRRTSGSSSGNLALQPHLHRLRQHRRPLLRCLEQAHRTTLEDHVHRPPPVDSRRSGILRIV